MLKTVKNVDSHIEFLFQKCIFFDGSFEIFVQLCEFQIKLKKYLFYQRHWNIKIQIKLLK